MSRSLDRILQLRELSEEIRRVALEREVRMLAEVERAIRASREESRASRCAVFAAIAGEGGEGWLLAEGAWELAEWQIHCLEPRLQAQRQRVEELRQLFLECRKEKRQVERLIETETKAAKTKALRREQIALDDWYDQSKRRKALPRG